MNYSIREQNKRQIGTMKTRSEYIELIKSHTDELKRRFGITSLSIFGSVARDEHREGSDVDIYVTMPPKFYNHVAAAMYLEELLESKVDLIQEHRGIRPFFRKQIETDGIRIL